MAAAVAVAVVGVDQATTSWALVGLRRPVHLLGPLGLALQYNAGTAFSLFASGGEWLTVAVVVVVVVMAVAAWWARSGLEGVGYGLVVGGALGNLADRFVRGHHGDVVDFVTLSHWPTFNVADACITAGVVLLAAGFLRRTRPTGAERSPEHR